MILYFIISIIAFILGVICSYIVYKIKLNYKSKEHTYGKHYCNDCERAFIYDFDVLSYTHCPYCGQKLDYINWVKETMKNNN